MRNQPIRIVWHDTPQADLLAQGLAAAEQRGRWRLEQIGLNGRDWPIGAPSPIIAESVDATGLEPPSPEALMPVAAFDGRTISFDLVRNGEPLTLRVLDGVLRGVTLEQPTARIQIAGSAHGVIGLALELADDLPISVPRAALASEAIAAVRAEGLQARRIGLPELQAEQTVPGAFARLSGHFADVMLYWGAEIASGSEALEPVHQMRVAMRRLRSAMSLFPAAEDAVALQELTRDLKALAAVLGPARDWDVFCSQTGQAVGDAFAPEEPVARLIARAERRRAEHYRTLRAYLHGPRYRKLMIRLAGFALAEAWEAAAGGEAETIRNQSLGEFAAMVIDRRHKRLLSAGEEIDHLEAEELHKIRLQAKRMRYAAELFGPLWGSKATRRFIRRLAALQECLGVLNDGAVATRLMAELAGNGADRALAVGIVRGFMAGRSMVQREEIAKSWSRFRRSSPFWTL